MLYEVLKTAKMGAGQAPDLYTALLAKNLRRDGEVKTLSGIPPLTFRSNGQPLLDYLISGNTVQSGTPTPDNPIMPQGTGERTGNLFDFEQLKNAPSGTIGSITFSHVLTLQLKANTYYTMASNGTGSTSSTPADLYRSVYFNATTGEASVNRNNPVTVLTDSTGVVRIGFFSERTNAEQYLSGEAQLWINEGSTPLPYEPYGYKIPISSANATTPVYLGKTQSTRKIKKLKLLSSLGWNRVSNGAFYTTGITDYLFVQKNVVRCSHFGSQINTTGTSSVNDNKVAFYFNNSQRQVREFYVAYRSITSLDEFKAFLDNNDVYIWYVLANETTGIVNEPLRKIGEYADTLSMEQAGVQIPTAKGRTTLDVETTVKPSEVYIKYKS